MRFSPNSSAKPKSGFLSVEELGFIFNAVQSAMYDHHGGLLDNRAAGDILKINATPFVIEKLKEIGVTQIKLLGHGDHAVLIETPDRQAFRFRGRKTEDPSTWNPPDIDQTIAAMHEFEIMGCRITRILKVPTLRQKVDAGEISQETAVKIIDALAIAVVKQSVKSVFWDAGDAQRKKFEQVGFLPDGTPIIIDTGSVVSFEDLMRYLEGDPNKKIWADRVEVLSKSALPNLAEIGWDGSWLTATGQRKTVAANDQFNAAVAAQPEKRQSLGVATLKFH